MRSSRAAIAEHGVRYFGYDQIGNRIVETDERVPANASYGNATYFAYDGLNRLSTTTDALFNQTYLGYDNRSSLVKRLDADGRCTYVTYDAAERMPKKSFTNPRIREHPERCRSYVRLADAFERPGEPERALDVLQQAQRAEADDTEEFDTSSWGGSAI